MAYVDLTTRFTYGLQTVFGDFSKLANNDKFIKENGWQDGTVSVFFQAAAPTGWTKVTTADARALRIVSGSGGGIAGTTDPSTSITLQHSHVITAAPAHSHLVTAHSHHIATSGTDQANGGSVIPLIMITATQEMVLKPGAGASSVFSKSNVMPLVGTYGTGSGGIHDHGGSTSTELTNLSLAYANVLFCSKDTSSGYTDLSATFVHNVRHVFDYLEESTQNDAYNYARRTPAGTVSIFASASSPVGWTKLATTDGAMLRVVSGTGAGTGGVTDPALNITLAHDHGNLTNDSGHTHSIPDHSHLLTDNTNYFVGSVGSVTALSGGQIRQYSLGVGSTVNPVTAQTNVDGGGTSASNIVHTHRIGNGSAPLADITLAYFNVIQASKDSTGAPTSYTDRTGFFIDQAVLAYQDLQYLANNDAYLYYHTMPSAAVMLFFQSTAPLNWTKLVTQNDCIARIVAGSGGTGSGTAPLSSGITLAHTHTIASDSHTHDYSHSHAMAVAAGRSITTLIGNTRIFGGAGAEIYRDTIGGAGDTSLGGTTDTQTMTTDAVVHDHGGLTSSALADLHIAYADVIMCSKN